MLIDFHLIVYCFFPSKFCFNICLALSLVLYPDGLWDVLPTLYPAALSIFLSTKVFSEYINQQLVYTFRMWFIFNLDMIKWCYNTFPIAKILVVILNKSDVPLSTEISFAKCDMKIFCHINDLAVPFSKTEMLTPLQNLIINLKSQQKLCKTYDNYQTSIE